MRRRRQASTAGRPVRDRARIPSRWEEGRRRKARSPPRQKARLLRPGSRDSNATLRKAGAPYALSIRQPWPEYRTRLSPPRLMFLDHKLKILCITSDGSKEKDDKTGPNSLRRSAAEAGTR